MNDILNLERDLSTFAERCNPDGAWVTDLIMARDVCERIGDTLHSVSDAMPWMRQYHKLARIVGYRTLTRRA